jgi:hypothetical protein
MTISPYRHSRLDGRGNAGNFAIPFVESRTVTLWLGPDHLLRVENSGYAERYKRFLYRDIQAIIIRAHPVADQWWNVGFIVMALLALLGGVTVGGYGWYGFGPMAASMLLCLVINLWRGPSCTCHVRTAVQTEALSSLNRLRVARRALDRLRPLILAAQADLPSTATTPSIEMAACLPSWRSTSAATSVKAVTFGHKFHRYLFATLAGLAAVILVSMLVPSPVVLLLMVVLGAIGVILVIGGLIHVHHAKVDGELMVATWASAVLLTCLFIAYYVFLVYMGIMHSQERNNQWQMAVLASEEIAEGSITWTVIAVVTTIVAASLSGWGFYCLYRMRKACPTVAPPMPSPPPPPIPAFPRENAS